MNKRSYVITFSGKAGSGKDTFVKLFIEYIRRFESYYSPKYYEKVLLNQAESGIDNTVYSFGLADYFKSLFTRNFGYTEENKADFRSQLQYFGTEIGRSYHENMWINPISDMIQCINTKTPCRLYILTDARFKNELEILNWSGMFKTYNAVVRSNDNRVKMTSDQLQHSSESMSEDDSIHYNIVINNEGTLEDLEDQAKELAIEVLKNIEFRIKVEEDYDTIPNN